MAVPISRVYLTGFMGAGKTTVGRLLSARLGWAFYDSDALIEAEQQMPIASLFARIGEPAFRQLESRVIQKLHAAGQAVISLGGGSLESEDVRALLIGQPGNHVVFLDAPLSHLVQRCMAQDGGAARPLLQDRDHLEQRHQFRRAYYEQAHLTVATQSLTPEEVAASIHNSLPALHHGTPAKPSC